MNMTLRFQYHPYLFKLEIEGSSYEIYVLIRPGVTEFLREMSKIYELVIYTASLEIVININISTQIL
jgi:TFIIF-interacting CTD phosphatase-like protein